MTDAITDNVLKHERIASDYDRRHPEIYNDIEQTRLHKSLSYVRSMMTTEAPKALDYGCGTGNITRHLVELGFQVEAADVTPTFVEKVINTFKDSGKVSGRLLNGVDLADVPVNSFDVVTVYSVLHHIPDYLTALREMVRVLKPGGILFIDHEFAPEYWSPSQALIDLRSATAVKTPLTEYLRRLSSPAWYVKRFKKTVNPRYQEEGDIHVWPDDHIDWDLIVSELNQGTSIVRTTDYLYYQSQYPTHLFETYKTRCADLRELILVKKNPLS